MCVSECESVYSGKGEVYATERKGGVYTRKASCWCWRLPLPKQLGPLTYPDPAPL